jgi:putative ABC transport system permease protein
MIKNYLTIALKVLARRKFFTFVSLFGISFTLMLLMLATAFLDHSFSPMGVEHRFGRVLTAEMFRMRSPNRDSNWNSQGSYYLIDHYLRPVAAQSNGQVEVFSIYRGQGKAAAFVEGQKVEFSLRQTDAAYFSIVDLDFVEGAAFTQADFEQRAFLAVISEAMRDRYFRGRPALGQPLSFDGQTYRVAGVVRNVPENREEGYADVWVPLSTDKNQAYAAPPEGNQHLMGEYRCAFLLSGPEAMEPVRAAVRAAMGKVEFPDPKEYNLMETAARTRFQHQAAYMFGEWETRFSEESTWKLQLAIALAMCLFMLLPSLNLVNLNLSRMMERASEIGVRRAFGASTGALLRQFVVENVFISLLGGALGVALSVGGLAWLNASGWYQYADFGLNYRVLAFGLLLTIAFGLLSGTYPAWRMAQLHPVQALKGASK